MSSIMIRHDHLAADAPCRCDNCDWRGLLSAVCPVVSDLEQRTMPGEEVPAGECPECGALAHLDESGGESEEPRPVVSVAAYGRIWFQRSYGNTYHTVCVLVDGREVYRSPSPEYGYGDQWQRTAADALEAWTRKNPGRLPEREHYANGGREPIRLWMDRAGVMLHRDVIDVPRERDL